jgi:hypothetical protein
LRIGIQKKSQPVSTTKESGSVKEFWQLSRDQVIEVIEQCPRMHNSARLIFLRVRQKPAARVIFYLDKADFDPVVQRRRG